MKIIWRKKKKKLFPNYAAIKIATASQSNGGFLLKRKVDSFITHKYFIYMHLSINQNNKQRDL